MSGEATLPSASRCASAPATRPCAVSMPGASSGAASPVSGSSKASSAREVATHSVWVRPNRAPASRSSSIAAATHSPSPVARSISRTASSTPRPVTASARSTAGSSKAGAACTGAPPSPASSARNRFCMALMPSSPKADETAAAS